MKKLKVFSISFLIWFCVHEVIIIIDGINDSPIKSEYGVIFGNKVNPDGQMSDRLKARVDIGVQLYKDSTVDKIFVSGGLGKEGFYEAQVMASYLMKNGIPKSKITIDNFGNNSWLTASNFKKALPSCTSVVIVSQFYHITRSKLAFKKIGIAHVSGASPSYYELRDFYSLFREFFGYYKYLIVF